MEPREHPVKAVLLDLGGTLVKTSRIPRVMKRILKHRGINRSLNDISHAQKKAEEKLDFRDLTRLLGEFWVLWSERILRNLQVQSNIRALAEFITTHWWDYCDVTLYPDSEKTLPLLKEKGLRIGLVTNGLQSDVDAILPKVDLESFFNVIVVIDTLRKMKPDVEVFHHALKKLQTAPSEAIFIGDEIETDYKGAQRSGVTPYLIDRTGRVHEPKVNKISSLDDLFKLNLIQT